MSGHSKWSTIKRQKETTDKQRGKLFTKFARAISLAVKEGSGITDPENNFKLRLAIENARQANLPKVNIERAIANGTGSAGGEGWQEIVYEGYGPVGVAVMVEAVTDNRNRALTEIKQLFERSGGALGQPGSVSYLFDKTGWLWIAKDASDMQNLLLAIMDIEGVLDVEEDEEGIVVWTDPVKLKSVQTTLKNLGRQAAESELSMKPKSTRTLTGEEKLKVHEFLEKLEDSDEVQHVWSDAEI